MNSQEAIKKRILYFLNEKNLSINKVAANGLLNFSTVNGVLNGHSKKTEISTVAKICYGLGITLFDFFNDDMFKSIDEYEI